MPNPNYDDIFTTTIESRTRELRDNVTKNNALLSRLSERGRIQLVSGGSKILQEMDFEENGSYKRYAGSEALNTGISQFATAAEYPWRQVAVTVEINGLEGDVQNTGPEAFIDLMGGRVENGERSMRNGLSADAYSDGSADSGKQIDGLQNQVADSPATGVVGGIDRANNPQWRNQTRSANLTSANIVEEMTALYLSTARGSDHVDLIMTTNDLYAMYINTLQAQQRFRNPRLANLGFETVRFMTNADVVFDGGVGGACPDKRMYFLNTNFLHWRPHRGRNIVSLADRNVQDADVMRRFLVWAGNMTMSGAQYQGVLIDTTP